jgi:hypothetical protein
MENYETAGLMANTTYEWKKSIFSYFLRKKLPCAFNSIWRLATTSTWRTLYVNAGSSSAARERQIGLCKRIDYELTTADRPLIGR